MSGKHWEGGRERDVRHAGCNWGGGTGSHVLERDRRTFDEDSPGAAPRESLDASLSNLSSAKISERYSCSRGGWGR